MSNLYSQFILTVIAASLVFICVQLSVPQLSMLCGTPKNPCRIDGYVSAHVSQPLKVEIEQPRRRSGYGQPSTPDPTQMPAFKALMESLYPSSKP